MADNSISTMDDPNVARHRVLSSIVSSLCINSGFVEIETFALETLTEMLTACMYIFSTTI